MTDSTADMSAGQPDQERMVAMSSVAERTPPAQGRTGAAGRRPSPAALLQGLAIGLGFVLMVGGFGAIAVSYRPYRIPTNSMSPTVEPGDTVLAKSVSADGIGRGDIVIFHDAVWGPETMVKRVAGVGGDTVAYSPAGGGLTVNGKPVDESYLTGDRGDVAFSVQVPQGRLFLLGDDRTVSLDSRSHLQVAAGTIPATEVTGRVAGRAWPFDRMAVQQRTAAFDSLGGPTASGPGLLQPATYAMVGGAALIVLVSALGGVVGLVRRLSGRKAG
ncbi:signal peptidase I [Kitasatospora sp. NPDC002227]|uniref:signal peptidase I n=1 Tax=Kitasatospora sp. NPDC002227 TaxID=3154773 RepID=UPI00332C2C81